MTPDPHDLASGVKHKARELGFDLCRIATAAPSEHTDHFKSWLAQGRHGSMQYMARRVDERLDPAIYFPGTRSVMCVAMNYHTPLQDDSPTADVASPQGRIARSALGADYHKHLKDRLYDLADWVRAAAPGAQTKCGTDTVPLLERELAELAGIGWIGKNTCVINPDIGSWLLLGEVLTTIDLPADESHANHCGTCTRCIEACPTQAIVAPYQIDARRCISYLTIEHAGDIDEDLKSRMSDWIFGCDICQDVCPFNGRAPDATDPLLQPRVSGGKLDLNQLLAWRQEDYSRTFSNMAVKRIKLPVLKRNAEIALNNASSQ